MKTLPWIALGASIILNLVLLLRPPAAPPEPTSARVRPALPTSMPVAAPALPESRVEVAQTPAAAPTAPVEKLVVTITASPGVVQVRGDVTGTWTVVSGKRAKGDWVGLFEVGGETHVAWRYVDADTGTLTFGAPRKAGAYDFRYVQGEGRAATARSNAVTVLDVASAPSVAVHAELTYVRAGEPIPVRWTVVPGRALATDWVGVFQEGADNKAYQAWSYVPEEASGSVALKAPSTPGLYEIRYLLDNGYEAAAASARIVVAP